jgi:hypothetical protein
MNDKIYFRFLEFNYEFHDIIFFYLFLKNKYFLNFYKLLKIRS